MTAISDDGDKSSPRGAINSVGVQEYANVTYVPRSYAELQKRTIAIARDKEIQSHGIKVASIGPDIDHNKIRIRLLWEYNATAAEYLINRYGRDWVTVDTTPQKFLPTVVG